MSVSTVVTELGTEHLCVREREREREDRRHVCMRVRERVEEIR